MNQASDNKPVSELQQIAGFRERILNADTLEELQKIADDMIGHHEGIDDDGARDFLLDYLSEWKFDVIRSGREGQQ